MKSSEPAQAPLLERATVILLPFGWTNVVSGAGAGGSVVVGLLKVIKGAGYVELRV